MRLSPCLGLASAVNAVDYRATSSVPSMPSLLQGEVHMTVRRWRCIPVDELRLTWTSKEFQ